MYLADQVACIKSAVAALQTQVRQLKERTEFIWCNTRPLVEGDIVTRVGDIEDDVDSINDAIDEIEVITDSIGNCGVLTIDCESSDSDSGSLSGEEWPSMLISGTTDPFADGTFVFQFELFGSVYYVGGAAPLQRLAGFWYIGSPGFGWVSEGGEALPSDVAVWTAEGGATGSPVVTLA